jgi:hypothetical protein
MKTNKILLSGTAVVALAGEISYGLTTSEIVAKSESSVVAIIEENTATHEYWQGTGWFITGNRIVTNEHVVSNERPCDQMRIVNVATLKHYTVGHIAYRDTTTDVAVIVINESNASHLNFSELNPAPGIDVVVIGNPLEDYGKVTTGTIIDVFNCGVDKETNAIYLDAGLQAGDSGSPVLDSNGDVLGMVWGANSKKNGEGAAVRVQTLKLAAVDVVDTKVAAAQSQAKITPRAVPRAKLVDPRSMADIAKAANDKIFFSGVHLGMTIDECVTYYDKIADGGIIEHSGAPSGERNFDFRTRGSLSESQRRVSVYFRKSDRRIVSVTYWKMDEKFSPEEIRYLTDLNKGPDQLVTHLYDDGEFEITTAEQDQLESAPLTPWWMQ